MTRTDQRRLKLNGMKWVRRKRRNSKTNTTVILMTTEKGSRDTRKSTELRGISRRAPREERKSPKGETRDQPREMTKEGMVLPRETERPQQGGNVRRQTRGTTKTKRTKARIADNLHIYL